MGNTECASAIRPNAFQECAGGQPFQCNSGKCCKANDTLEGKEKDLLEFNQTEEYLEIKQPYAQFGRITFTVTLRRLGKEWPDVGLTLSVDDDPINLTVDEVREPSLVADWNACHGVLERVMVGDIVSSVNERSVGGAGMLKIFEETSLKNTVLSFKVETRMLMTARCVENVHNQASSSTT